MDLFNEFNRLKNEVHEAFCDSIDTRTVLEKLREIIKLSNIYIMVISFIFFKHFFKNKEKETILSNSKLLRDIAVYVTNILQVFGLISSSHQGIGFSINLMFVLYF